MIQMKSYRILIVLGCMILICLSGCQEKYNIAAFGKLYKVYKYYTFDINSEPYIAEVYEYDNKGRIIKMSEPWYLYNAETGNNEISGIIAYYTYDYNELDQLIRKVTYWENSGSETGYIIGTVFRYSYNPDGNLEKETTGNLAGDISEYTTYEYEEDHLVLIRNFNWADQIESYTENEYDESGRLIKEWYYFYDHLWHFTVHKYSDGLLKHSYSYSEDSTLANETERSYDKFNNIIFLKYIQYSICSSIPDCNYMLKYEYYR